MYGTLGTDPKHMDPKKQGWVARDYRWGSGSQSPSTAGTRQRASDGQTLPAASRGQGSPPCPDN